MVQKVVEGQEVRLNKLQERLVNGAEKALHQPTFDARNEAMAEVVASVSVSLMSKFQGPTMERLEAAGFGYYPLNPRKGSQGWIETSFHDAAVEAGNAFKSAFTADGKKIESREEDYNKAMKAAGAVAEKHLVSYAADKISATQKDRILSRAAFSDAIELVAMRLGESGVDVREAAKALSKMSPDQIKNMLHDIAKGDYFEENIDSMPMKRRSKADEKEINFLDYATRLANATWMVGQVHRAAWEGNTSRIDPEKREAFNPYDLLMTTQFRRQLDEGRAKGLSEPEARQQAIARVAFEVWKDIHQYQELHK